MLLFLLPLLFVLVMGKGEASWKEMGNSERFVMAYEVDLLACSGSRDVSEHR